MSHTWWLHLCPCARHPLIHKCISFNLITGLLDHIACIWIEGENPWSSNNKFHSLESIPKGMPVIHVSTSYRRMAGQRKTCQTSDLHCEVLGRPQGTLCTVLAHKDLSASQTLIACPSPRSVSSWQSSGYCKAWKTPGSLPRICWTPGEQTTVFTWHRVSQVGWRAQKSHSVCNFCKC